MQCPSLESALDAQRAFYDAFQRCDINDMMLVWGDDEDIVCVHPGGPRLHGITAVRNSWEQVFSQGIDWSFRLSNGQCLEDELLSIHQVQENIYEHNRLQGIVIATNIFHSTPGGWRMVLHHASPSPRIQSDALPPNLAVH